MVYQKTNFIMELDKILDKIFARCYGYLKIADLKLLILILRLINPNFKIISYFKF